MKLPKMEISKNHVTDKYKIWVHTMQDIPTIMEDMCSQMHNVGNNRIVTDAHGNVEKVNHYYPYGGLMGDSRNAATQPYKYITGNGIKNENSLRRELGKEERKEDEHPE